MRDLIERGGFVSPIHRAAVMEAAADLTRSDARAPAGTADGVCGVGRSTVHAGAGEGRGRYAKWIGSKPPGMMPVDIAILSLEDAKPVVQDALSIIYARALGLANAEPSVPIPVAEKQPMTCHKYLGLQDRSLFLE